MPTPLAAAAVAIVTAFTFAPALRNGFVNFDDRVNLVDNQMFRGFDLHRLVWMATTFHMGHWQPLSWLSFAVDHALWGLDPRGYHLTNLVLHAANAVLLLLLGRRLLTRFGFDTQRATLGAVFGALLWAVHPLRVESVAWATERRDVLCGTFTLLAVFAYIGESGRRRLPAVLLAMALAVTAKASAMMLPALFVLLDVYPLRRLGGAAGWRDPAVWREKVPILALGVAAAVVALAAQHAAGALAPGDELGWSARVGAAMVGLGFYLRKTFVPTALVPLYEYPADLGPLHPQAVAGIAVFGAALAGALALRRRCPALLAALAAYAIAVAPTLGLAQSGLQLVADRYSYLPLVGLSVVAGGLAVTVLPDRRVLAFAAPLLVLLAIASARQTTAWRDGETLWQRALAADPRNAMVHANLGDVAFYAGDFTSAARHFRDAVALRPDMASLHLNLGRSLAGAQRFADAATEYGEAIRLAPRMAPAYASLGVALANLRRDDEAIAAYRRALELEPRQMEVHGNLGMLLAEHDQTDAALAEYDAALALERTTVILNDKALLLQKTGRAGEAVGLLREAVRTQPDASLLHENLAYALIDAGDRAGAVDALEQAIRLDPEAEQPRRVLAELRASR